MPHKAPVHAFKKGNPGGPGRPKGSKSILPAMREIMGETIGENRDDVKEAYRRAVTSTKQVVAALAEYGRANKETGSGSEAAGAPALTLIINGTKLDSSRLR